MEEKILTPDQVAEKLQIHPFTVLKFIKQGKLKASKLGRVYRIRESDVEAFLDNQTAANHSHKNSEKKSDEREEKKLPESASKHIMNDNFRKEISSEALLGSESLEESFPEKLKDSEKKLPADIRKSNNDHIQPDHYILD